MLLFQTYNNTRKYPKISQNIPKKKRFNLPNWLCFTARRSKDSSTQQLHDVMVSRQSSHSMTSCPPADRCSICGLYFWWFRRDSLHVTPQASSTIRKISCNANQLNVQLERLMSAKTCVRCTIWHYADPFYATLHCLHVRCTILHYAEPFHATLHNLCVRCTIRHYAEPFHAMLHHLCVRYTIWDYAEPFRATVHCFYARYTIRHYAKLFHVTLHRLCNVLQMSTKLFVIKLVYFTISCSNSTWATRLFIIWLNYSCLGCSVSWRKTKPSIIWQCHSFISYSILQLILKPAFYLLIYLTFLYKRLWRPPIEPLFVSLPVVLCQRRLTPPPP